MEFPVTPGYSTPTPGSPLRVFSWSRGPRARAAGWFLTHWRYPQNALSRWCPRQYALQQRSLPAGGHAQAPTAGWLFVLSSALLSKLKYSRNSQITQNTTISNRCPLSSRNHRLNINECNEAGSLLSGSPQV